MITLNFSYTSYFKVTWSNQLKNSIVYSKNIAYFLSFIYVLIGSDKCKIKIVSKPRRRKLLSLVITPQTSKRKAFQFTRIKYKNSLIVRVPSNTLSVSNMLRLNIYASKLSKIFLSILSFHSKTTVKSNVNMIYIK